MQVIRRRRLVTEPLGHVEPLDGLRAVAVMGVVLYHARFTWIPGGFLGVSTFFTLSGFLITSLLLREWNSSDEGVDLRRFWRRRFRRLLPASWMTIGAVLLMALVGIWNTDQLRSLRGDVPFALAEIINWHFIAQDRSYGADFLAPSPLEHFWSLAVEQQFYVILPLLVVGVLALGRRRPARQRIGALAAVFVALAAFSAISNGWYARTSIDRAYFGTDTRMAEMLVGSLLAIATLRRLRLPPSLARRVSIALGLTAIVVTGWLWHNATLDAAWLYPWGLLLSAGCTAAIVFAAIQGGGLGRVLSLPPLLWLGRISYGVYLLHWPVFLWLTPARVGWSDWPLFALRMAVTCALAVAMFRLIENPVRHGQRLKGRRAPLTALLAAFALLAATAWVTRDLPPPSALVTATQEQAATPTTLPPPPVRVAVVGDQVAASLGETISGVDGLDVTVSTAPDCGLTVGGFITTSDGRVERDVDRCGDVPRQWVETVQQSRPDVVLVVGTMRDAAARRLDVNNPWTGPQDPQVAEFLRSDIAVLTDDLAAGGAEVVLVTVPRVRNAVSPVPIPDPAPNPSAAEESLLQIERQQVRDGNPGPGFRENEVARVDQVNGSLGGHRARSPATGPVGADAHVVRWRVQRGAAHRRRRLHRGGRLRNRRVAPAPAARAPHGGRRGGTATRDRPRHTAAARAAGTGPPHRRCRTTGRRAGRGGLGRLHGRVRTRGLGRRQRRGARDHLGAVRLRRRTRRQLPVPARPPDLRGALRLGERCR
jgi:peptidoglycan/LPS O-acetylase OafA/YrhL